MNTKSMLLACDELMESFSWRRSRSLSHEKLQPLSEEDDDSGLLRWARIGRWLATMMVRSRRNEEAGELNSESDSSEDSMSGMIPGTVTRRGISRRSRPSDEGSPEANSSRLE